MTINTIEPKWGPLFWLGPFYLQKTSESPGGKKLFKQSQLYRSKNLPPPKKKMKQSKHEEVVCWWWFLTWSVYLMYIYNLPCFFCLLKVFDMKTKRPPRRSSQKKPTPSNFKTKPAVNWTPKALAHCPLAWRPSQCHGPLALPGAVLFGTRRCGTTPTLPAPVSRAWLAICLWQMSWGILFGGEKGLGEISSWISFCYIDHIDVFSLLLFVPRSDVVGFSIICSSSWDYYKRFGSESRFFMLVVWCLEMLRIMRPMRSSRWLFSSTAWPTRRTQFQWNLCKTQTPRSIGAVEKNDWFDWYPNWKGGFFMGTRCCYLNFSEISALILHTVHTCNCKKHKQSNIVGTYFDTLVYISRVSFKIIYMFTSNGGVFHHFSGRQKVVTQKRDFAKIMEPWGFVMSCRCVYTLGIQSPENGNRTYTSYTLFWGDDCTPQSSSDKVIGILGIQNP